MLTKKKISILPKTSLGKKSMWLMASFFGLYILGQIIVIIGLSQGAFYTDSKNIYLTLISIIRIPVGLFGIAGFILGLISIIKFKERSWLVYVSVFIGFLISFFVLKEFLIPY